MKAKHLPWLLSLVMLASSTIIQAAAKVDGPAPTFSLVNSYGESVSLADHKGKYVILEWTNHQCPYVRKHYGSGNMQGLQAKYTAEEVIWLSIISSAPGTQGYVSADEANELTRNRNANPTHVLFDPEGDVGKQYGARTTPHMYIIDPEGILRYNGAIDSIRSARESDIRKAVNYVETGMRNLFTGSPVDPQTTTPYGCSVKYKS